MALTPRRQAILTECEWWLKNTAQIHYAQTRPMPLAAAKAHHLPLTTDCSGAVTCIYHNVGASDPNDLGYNGAGYTGTLAANGETIKLSEVLAGDLVICSRGDVTEHVYLVMNKSLFFSHGREAGPETQSLAGAESEWGVSNLHARRYLAVVVAKPHWVVLNGRGNRIGKTQHPAIWASRNARKFRANEVVRFEQR